MMDDDDFITAEDVYGASDEETDHIKAEKKHAKLLDSISALDGVKRSKLSERTVLTGSVTEFGFNQPKAERKVRLHELIGSLQNTSSHGELKKQLRTVNKRNKVASVPLSKVEETKIQRTTAYEKTKEDLSKWNSIVAENRKAEQISFPLQQPNLKLQTTDEIKSRFKPRTPLEIEIAALLQKNADTVGTHEAELTPAEERALKAMSLEEARERRAELQKYRALLTYKQARAKREKKIKSKKYHRILKKERLKKEKSKLEELQRTDPEAYVEKLEEMERSRVKERMTLKHRGGSKFALRQKIYGKYDDRSREAVQSMLQTHKELTKKVQVQDDSDDHSESGVSLPSDDEEATPTQLVMTKGDNPWMKVKTTSKFSRPAAVQNEEKESSEEEETDSSEGEEEEIRRTSDTVEPVSDNDEEEDDVSEDEDEEVEGTSDEGVGQEEEEEEDNEVTFKTSQSSDKEEMSDLNESDEEEIQCVQKQSRKRKSVKEPKAPVIGKPASKIGRENGKSKQMKKKKEDKQQQDEDNDIDSLFQNLSDSRLERAKNLAEKERQKLSSASKKKKNLKRNINQKTKEKQRTVTDKRGDNSEESDEDLIDQSLNRKRTLEDMEGGFESMGKTKRDKLHKKEENSKTDRTEDVYVDPKKLFTLTTKLTNTASVDIVTDEDGRMDAEDQQRLTIAQAFAEDDVVDEFTKEKADIIDRDKQKDINLTLPGWGDWGGTGLKPSRKKRRRFTLKAPDTGPRLDRGLGNVIISQKVEEAVATHQVSRLPFPYTSAEQFEQSIRAPIGKNWNPETAFRKLIQPKVVTKLGKIISPINKSDVFKNKKSKTENEEDKVVGGPLKNKKANKSRLRKK